MELTPEERTVIKKLQATQPEDITLFDLFAENAELQERLDRYQAAMHSASLIIEYTIATLHALTNPRNEGREWAEIHAGRGLYSLEQLQRLRTEIREMFGGDDD